jgi:hypothetical protein
LDYCFANEHGNVVIALAERLHDQGIGLCPFLGVFAKQLRKATAKLVMSVCPSVCPHGTPTGRIFVKFHI